MTNLVFFGSSKYAAQVLAALVKDGRYNVSLVVTQPDAPAGREQKLTPTVVATFVEAMPASPTIIKPSSLNGINDINVIKIIKDLAPTVGVMLDYGLLIPKEIIDLFPEGIINLHTSLLPRHRGAIPAVSTILEGDKVTGITIIKINERFDQGEIIAQEEEAVLQDDVPAALYERLFKKAITLLLKVLPEYFARKVTPHPQIGRGGPYEKRLTKASGQIDWQKDDAYLERFVRAMTPWPGAWTTVAELQNRFSNPPTPRNPSTSTQTVKILKAKLNAQGRLEIIEVQLEGKGPTTWQAFKNGYLK